MMNKSIIALLISILGLNIFSLFIKDRLDFPFMETMSLKDSTTCVNLNEKRTFDCLTEVMTLGTADGNDLMLLGQMHLYGLGTEVNREQAITLLETSAMIKKNAEAMVLLGDLYLQTDMLSSKYWYTRATNNANLEAQLKLAKIYRYGEEEDQDPQIAFELYKTAANQGSLTAQYELALMYAMGIGTDPHLDRSLFMLEQLCDKKHMDSCILQKKILELKQRN